MKVLVLYSIISISGFLVSGEHGHYVEGESSYIWIPDAHGVPYLITFHRPVNVSIFNYQSGANNEYWLYTRCNPSKADVIVHGNASTIWDSSYNYRNPLNIIVHGWRNDGNSPMNEMITSAFLSVQDANVIVVDWRTLASSNYTTASDGVLNVGQHLGSFLEWLMEVTAGNWNHVHMVGFSLGAHVVGIAGRYTGGKPGRITGLDPAGPQWNGKPYALNRNCGKYVEAIHTNGGTFGTFEHLCHSDFYLNGGANQPGCSVNNSCSHGRSTEVFASSIRFNHLIGRLCSNLWEARFSKCSGPVLRLGNSIIPKRGRGIYGLVTKDTWPY